MKATERDQNVILIPNSWIISDTNEMINWQGDIDIIANKSFT